jgi:hypothetical protein
LKFATEIKTVQNAKITIQTMNNKFFASDLLSERVAFVTGGGTVLQGALPVL